MELKEDEGTNRASDVIKYALIYFQRGFNDGLRDVIGIAPNNEAILDVVKLFLKEKALNG